MAEMTREDLMRTTVEVWDGEDAGANQFDARVVDVTRIGDRWHLIVVADV